MLLLLSESNARYQLEVRAATVALELVELSRPAAAPYPKGCLISATDKSNRRATLYPAELRALVIPQSTKAHRAATALYCSVGMSADVAKGHAAANRPAYNRSCSLQRFASREPFFFRLGDRIDDIGAGP